VSEVSHIELARLIEAMSTPTAYPASVGGVEVCLTLISVVLLVGTGVLRTGDRTANETAFLMWIFLTRSSRSREQCRTRAGRRPEQPAVGPESFQSSRDVWRNSPTACSRLCSRVPSVWISRTDCCVAGPTTPHRSAALW
jgi:hypothetical protein